MENIRQWWANAEKLLTHDQDKVIPAGNHMFKVNNKNIRTRYEICSKLALKIGIFIVNFEQVNAGWGIIRQNFAL